MPWQVVHPHRERQALYALGSTLVVLGAEDVRCFDLATGRLDSARPLPTDWSSVADDAVVVGDRLIGRIGRASVAVIEPCTAHVEWMTSLAADTVSFAARGDTVLVAGASHADDDRCHGSITSLDVATGVQRWAQPTDACQLPEITTSDRTVYVMATSAPAANRPGGVELRSFDAASGRPRWHARVDDERQIYSAIGTRVVERRGQVFVATSHGVVVLDRDSGRASSSLVLAIADDRDGDALAQLGWLASPDDQIGYGVQDHDLGYLDPSTRALRWHRPGAWLRAVATSEQVFALDRVGWLTALRTADGSVVWRSGAAVPDTYTQLLVASPIATRPGVLVTADDRGWIRTLSSNQPPPIEHATVSGRLHGVEDTDWPGRDGKPLAIKIGDRELAVGRDGSFAGPIEGTGRLPIALGVGAPYRAEIVDEDREPAQLLLMGRPHYDLELALIRWDEPE